MEDQFVPYELALKLKQLGFNASCLARYRRGKFQSNTLCRLIDYNSNPIVMGDISAPLWQQVFDWCIEKHNLTGHITWYGGLEFPRMCFNYMYSGTLTQGLRKIGRTCDTYQEARQECLEKMINLIEDVQ